MAYDALLDRLYYLSEPVSSSIERSGQKSPALGVSMRSEEVVHLKKFTVSAAYGGQYL